MLSCSSTPSRSLALHYPTARLYQSGRWMLIVLGPMGGCNRCSRVSLRLLLSHQVRKEAGGRNIRGKYKKKTKLPGLAFHPYVHTYSSEDARMHICMCMYMCTYIHVIMRMPDVYPQPQINTTFTGRLHSHSPRRTTGTRVYPSHACHHPNNNPPQSANRSACRREKIISRLLPNVCVYTHSATRKIFTL